MIKNEKGITMVTLIVTIIVIIIIAAAAISTVVGQNNVLDKAQEIKLSEEQQSRRDALEQALIKYNAGNSIDGNIKSFLSNELSLDISHIKEITDLDGSISWVITDFGGDNAYLKEIEGVVEIIAFGNDEMGNIANGENLAKLDDGDVLIAPESGKEIDFSNSSNKQLAIIKKDDQLQELSFDIPEYTHVKIKLLSDMVITNENLKRAAINLREGAILDLQVESNVQVNSTFGEDAKKNKAGAGGYAGIHVPDGTTLNLSGSGVIKCYGGNAGNGGTATGGEADLKCAGGGGAGAGIGGNGGAGGEYKTGAGANGENGEKCGKVNISDVTVYAFGGAGGGGGSGTTNNSPTAGGAGGYPAAGIGGGGAGGAGGTCCVGAGGYSGGSSEGIIYYAVNGLCGGTAPNSYAAGGGYFQGATGMDKNTPSLNRKTLCFGGFNCQGWGGLNHASGYGGNGGAGGEITARNAHVYAYNGNMFTDSTSYGEGANQCPIYAQAGIIPAKYKYDDKYGKATFRLVKVSDQQTIAQTSYVNTMVSSNRLNINSLLSITGNPLDKVDMSKQGVGSGAGFTETSNGTYTSN